METVSLSVNGSPSPSPPTATRRCSMFCATISASSARNSAAAWSNAAAAWCWSTAAGKILRQGALDSRRQGSHDDRGPRHAASGRIRCNRRFSTSRPGNAAIASPASRSRQRRCSTITRRRRAARSPRRSTTTSAAAAATTASCAPSSAPPSRCARRSFGDERRRTHGAAAAARGTRASTNGSRFDQPGRVRVATGRVEIGQGVLTAMRQIAADELDVSPDRILLAHRRHRADAERGLHRRQPVDPVRRRSVAPCLRRSARAVSRPGRGRLRLLPAAELVDARRRDPASRRADRA